MVFEVYDPKGDRLTPVRLRTDETLVFKGGSTISRKVVLSDYFPFSEYGSYGVSAAVYYPPRQEFFSSNRVRANFTDAKAFWEQNFGVPMGLPGAGQIRRYSLTLLRDTDHTNLYVRVLDDRSGNKISTFALGTCIMVTDPQVTVDSSNKLHVLYMARPHIYAHATVDTQGRLLKATFHEEKQTNRPQLIVQADQSIAVQGGIPSILRPRDGARLPRGAPSVKNRRDCRRRDNGMAV